MWPGIFDKSKCIFFPRTHHKVLDIEQYQYLPHNEDTLGEIWNLVLTLALVHASVLLAEKDSKSE